MSPASDDRIGVERLVAMLVAMTEDLEQARDLLIELDSAVGDGDLGITVARGSAAVREGLREHGQDVGRVLMKAGMDFSNAAPSTMGALLGGAFMAAGKAVQGQAELTLPDVCRAVKAAEDRIREKGKAQPGDKTMLDALAPARLALEEAAQQGADLVAALAQARDAAEQGMKATTAMQAAFGRARWLGERTIGHQDPGATLVFLIAASFAKSAKRTHP